MAAQTPLRLNYYIEDIQIAKRVEAGKYGKFFIVPLQVFNDSQVRIHCDFPSVRSFLLHVLSSFAEHAPADTNIIIKHHPMDRGFIDYWRDIKRFIKEHPELKGLLVKKKFRPSEKHFRRPEAINILATAI